MNFLMDVPSSQFLDQNDVFRLSPGLYVPIITPFSQGKFDAVSMKRLIHHLEPQLEGFIPCLTSGEGHTMDDQTWEQVVTTVVKVSTKPVMPGIKPRAQEDMQAYKARVTILAAKAAELGCKAVVIPCCYETDEENIKFFLDLTAALALPILIYNTEKQHFITAEALLQLEAKTNKIIGIKDSSGSKDFFAALVQQKEKGLKMMVLQGMENLLLSSKGADGFLVALMNVEPGLCREVLDSLEHPVLDAQEDLHTRLMAAWRQYNLGGPHWYVTIKASLFHDGLIDAPEEVDQMPF